MLKKHADLAIECGVNKNNTVVLQNGDILAVTKDGIKRAGSMPADDVYVDGNRIGDVSNLVIRDRQKMSNDGILTIICTLDMKNKKLLVKPSVVTRGFILVNENIDLIKDISNLSKTVVTETLNKRKATFSDIKGSLINNLKPFLFERTGRRPIIMPIIMDTK